jgi:hypothetical protein
MALLLRQAIDSGAPPSLALDDVREASKRAGEPCMHKRASSAALRLAGAPVRPWKQGGYAVTSRRAKVIDAAAIAITM